MIKTCNDFLKTYDNGITRYSDVLETELSYQLMRPYAIMADGFGISIQASSGHYCKPRIDSNGKRISYTHVELGFPSEEDELINDYAEDDNYTETVYGYVPVEVVDKLIEKHGGIVSCRLSEHTFDAETNYDFDYEVDFRTYV